MIKRELELHRLNTHAESRVQMATTRIQQHCFQYGGHVGVNLIVGGCDVKGPQLIEISSDGNMYANSFLTMGSGCLAAMAILESEYREDMNEEEAVNVVTRAIEGGVYHDLGSGSNVDVCVIKKGKVNMMRNLKSDNHKVFEKENPWQFKPDSVKVLKEYRFKVDTAPAAGMPMEL